MGNVCHYERSLSETLVIIKLIRKGNHALIQKVCDAFVMLKALQDSEIAS